VPVACGGMFLCEILIQGFVCGWSYWLARAGSFGLQLVVIQNVMANWVSGEVYRYIWISVFFVVIILFNLLDVRRYGEIEYWLTVIKLATIVGLMILGILLPLGLSASTRLLGTSSDNRPIPCSESLDCLPNPGLACKAHIYQLT
jgi:amino acid permease